MTFDEVLDQVLEMLQRRGRVSYRALKRQFDLDDAYLADLKAEIVEVHHLAVDQDGKMLVWTGGMAFSSTAAPLQPAALDVLGVALPAAHGQASTLAPTAVPH